jgi:flagellar basal-body rod protein FlgC
MTEFDLLATAAGGMDAQRAAMDVAARNVAAAQASTPGHPYARLVAQFATESEGEDATPVLHFTGTTSEPGTGDALTELIAVLDAQRSYEANASIFDTGKRLAERTLELERGA